jgi:hypothetical protein
MSGIVSDPSDSLKEDDDTCREGGDSRIEKRCDEDKNTGNVQLNSFFC